MTNKELLKYNLENLKQIYSNNKVIHTEDTTFTCIPLIVAVNTSKDKTLGADAIGCNKSCNNCVLNIRNTVVNDVLNELQLEEMLDD